MTLFFPRPTLAEHRRPDAPRLVIPPRKPPKQFLPSQNERDEDDHERKA